MATTAILDRTTTGWSSEITQDKQTKTYTLSTNGTYVDKNIALKITASNASIDKSGSVSGSNCTLEEADISGVYVTGSGSMQVKTAGWVGADETAKTTGTSTRYINGITLLNSKTFKIDDGIYEWTISKDAGGNVTIL